MTDITPPHTQSYVYIEDITVPFCYPVTFTRNAFGEVFPSATSGSETISDTLSQQNT